MDKGLTGLIKKNAYNQHSLLFVFVLLMLVQCQSAY